MHPRLQLQTNQLLEIWFANSFNGFVIFSLRKCKCLWMMRMPLCTGYMRLDLGCGLLRACGGSPFLIKFICNLLYEGRGLEHMTYTQDARPPRSYVQRNPWTYFFVVLGRGESQPSMFCFNLFDTHTIDIENCPQKYLVRQRSIWHQKFPPGKKNGEPVRRIGDAAIEFRTSSWRTKHEFFGGLFSLHDLWPRHRKILLRRHLDPHKTVYKHTHLKHQTSQNIFSYFFTKYTHLIRHSP